MVANFVVRPGRGSNFCRQIRCSLVRYHGAIGLLLATILGGCATSGSTPYPYFERLEIVALAPVPAEETDAVPSAGESVAAGAAGGAMGALMSGAFMSLLCGPYFAVCFAGTGAATVGGATVGAVLGGSTALSPEEAERVSRYLDDLQRHALAWRLFCSGHAEEALEIERNHQVEYPDDIVAHGYFGVIAALMGMHEDALKGTERAARLSGNNPGIMTFYTYALACAGRNEQAKTLADSLQTQVLPRAPGSHLSMTYVKLGDFDRALELLREARDEKCPWFRGARFDPRIEELGADPRLQALY